MALAREQQHLYSLLSTLQKLPCCVQAGELGRDGGHMAAGCYLAAAYIAVALLKVATGARGSVQQLQSSQAAATAQQPVVSYLPSLVIFGRCLLQWAGQLQQQGPGLVLLASGAVPRE